MMNWKTLTRCLLCHFIWTAATVIGEEATTEPPKVPKVPDDDYIPHMEKLIGKLMENYTQSTRPVKDPSDAITISVMVNVYHIEELNEADQTFSVHAWVTVLWMDEYLKWSDVPGLEEFADVESLQLSKSQIWHPDIGIHNSAQGKSDAGFHRYYYGNTRSVVTKEGRVLTTFDTAIVTSCPMDLAKYPYDTQNCPIALGSWMYSIREVKVDYTFGYHLIGNKGLGMERFHAAGWSLLDSHTRKRYWTYMGVTDHKPEDQEDSNIWAVVELNLSLKRYVPYFGVIVVLPCLTTLALTLTSFWVPVWDVMVSGFCMSVLLQAFFLRDAVLVVPVAVDVTPRIMIFYGINLSITIASFSFCVLIKLAEANDVVPHSLSNSLGGFITRNQGTLSNVKASAIRTVRTLSIKSTGSLKQENEGIVETEEEGDKVVGSENQEVVTEPKRVEKFGERLRGTENVQYEFILIRRIMFGVIFVIEVAGLVVAAAPI